MATSSDERKGGGEGLAPADALAHGFRALVTALEEGFGSSWSGQRSLNETGEAVTVQGVETLMQVAPGSRAAGGEAPARSGKETR